MRGSTWVALAGGLMVAMGTSVATAAVPEAGGAAELVGGDCNGVVDANCTCGQGTANCAAGQHCSLYTELTGGSKFCWLG